jgi:hypothetical protein
VGTRYCPGWGAGSGRKGTGGAGALRPGLGEAEDVARQGVLIDIQIRVGGRHPAGRPGQRSFEKLLGRGAGIVDTAAQLGRQGV